MKIKNQNDQIDTNEKERLLKTQILSQTDIHPDNKWGNNSYLLIRQKKIMRKYKKIADYIELEEEDQQNIIEKRLKILKNSCLVGFIGFSFIILSKHVFRMVALRANSSFYQGSKLFTFSTLAYFTYLPQYYRLIDELYVPLIRKYKQQAIDMGFQDYEISED